MNGIRRIALVVVALAACNKAPPARAVVPPTTAEAEAIGKEFAGHMEPCDGAALDRLFDTALLADRAIANHPVGAAGREGFLRGLGSLGGHLCAQMAPKSHATYLHTQTVDGTPRPLVRLIINGGVNYLQLELDKRDGVTHVVDFYSFVNGEKLSETSSRLLGTAIATGVNDSDSVTMAEFERLRAAGDIKGAHEALQRLPVAVRNNKAFRIMDLQLLEKLDNDQYAAAVESIAKAYPNDPSLPLVQLDYFLLKKDSGAMLGAIDKLDQQVGSDPYLNVMRVTPMFERGEMTKAVDAAKKGIAAEPTLEPLWWALLNAQTKAKQYADAVATLDTLNSKFAAGVNIHNLGGDPRFAPLVESDEVKAWGAKQ
ncbi:MAG TPA: hypothetical protein VGM90_18665 [Kofleriaceae bacterium]